LERKIFDLLSKLATENPFCDVVFTGHSFGGVLATLGSMRYADKFPMMTVSCHVYGTPKIGGSQLRNFIHSLPNLNGTLDKYRLLS
jgi:pimeloyl-ACP methyl ester carboxylesterase